MVPTVPLDLIASFFVVNAHVSEHHASHLLHYHHIGRSLHSSNDGLDTTSNIYRFLAAGMKAEVT